MKIALFILSLLTSNSASATLIDLGDLTRDTSTGLDWLDLTATNNRSYIDVTNQLGAGGEFEGWRVASTNEALGLWASFGIVTPNYSSISIDTQDYTDFLNVVSLLGNIAYEADPIVYDFGTYGMTSDLLGGTSNGQNVIGAVHYPGNEIVVTHLYVDSHGITRTGANVAYGTYLVRSSPLPPTPQPPPEAVPTPATLALCTLGLAGLGWSRRKKV